MNEFDESTALRPTAAGEWAGHADPRREASTGMFGGWTAALLLRAALGDAGDAGPPCSLTVHFVKAITPGSELTIRTRLVGASRALSTWQAELSVAGRAAEASAIATVVFAKRRVSPGFTDPVMPAAPPPEGLPSFRPPGPFGQRSASRPVAGFPLFERQDARSVFWLRETSGRALDRLQLAYFADHFPPRSWSRRSEPGPYSTITLSVAFHASDAEIAALGDDDVLMEVEASRAEASIVAAQARIWSRGGVLLATTEQLGWFR